MISRLFSNLNSDLEKYGDSFVRVVKAIEQER